MTLHEELIVVVQILERIREALDPEIPERFADYTRLGIVVDILRQVIDETGYPK